MLVQVATLSLILSVLLGSSAGFVISLVGLFAVMFST
jgi:hypothetical protein